MKKYIGIILLIVIFSTSIMGCNIKSGQVDNKENTNEVLNNIEDKLIRFHVIANSDCDEDQSLKLKVRDEVLKYMSPKLENSKSLDESRKILKYNDNNVKKIAKKVIKEYGYDYDVETTLGKENFPDKTYGNITLPQGEYEAYRIVIGSGNGHNWWCVMFPPLCFIDMSKGQVAYDENEKQMKKVLNDEEYGMVDNTSDNEKVEIRFKILDEIGKIFE